MQCSSVFTPPTVRSLKGGNGKNEVHDDLHLSFAHKGGTDESV